MENYVNPIQNSKKNFHSDFFPFTSCSTISNQKKCIRKKSLRNQCFLFYFEWEGKYVNIKNVQTNDLLKIKMYQSLYPVSVEIHQFKIYVCGGYFPKAGLLNNCAIFNLTNKELDLSSRLCECKCAVSLVSTSEFIFCIGGYNEDNNSNYCEYFDNLQAKWKITSPLNHEDRGITVSFDDARYIYTFGGSDNNIFERLDVTSLYNKWENLNVNLSTKRNFGFANFLNDLEFLVCGGDNSEDIYFNIFSHKSLKLIRSKKLFNNYLYFSSKPLNWKDKLWIISPIKNILIRINIISLEFYEEKLNF